MSKQNKELARKIVDQLAVIKKSDNLHAAPEMDKEGNVTAQSKDVFYEADIPALGMGFAGQGKTKAEALDHVVEQLADQLDSGALTLSDTWAEDNLK